MPIGVTEWSAFSSLWEINVSQIFYCNFCISFIIPGCLKILPPEELENLEIPSVESPSFPIDRVDYVSETDGANMHGNADLIQHHTNATRFNLFTGYQTIREREQSYKVIIQYYSSIIGLELNGVYFIFGILMLQNISCWIQVGNLMKTMFDLKNWFHLFQKFLLL